MDYLLLNYLLPAVETTLTTESLPLALIADKKAQAHIRLKLGDNIISQIQDCKTSKAIICKLDTIYMRRNIMALGMLEEEYNSRKIHRSEKLQDYLDDLEKMTSEINSIEAGYIKPHKHTVRILNGLSEEEAYKNVISSLYSYATEKEDDTDPEYITGRLIDECKMFNLGSNKPKQVKAMAKRNNRMLVGPVVTRIQNKYVKKCFVL